MHLAIANISTTSADYASFVTAVTAAIGSRTDLSFDAGTGTLTYTGNGSPMADLVINLAAINDTLVEGNEQYKVVRVNKLSNASDLVDRRRRLRHRRRHDRLHRALGRHAAVGRKRLDRVESDERDHEHERQRSGHGSAI